LTSTVSFWITQRRVNQQAEEAFRDKVRQITGMAGATRVWFSDNIDTLVPGKSFKSLNQVPVVAAWSVARQYATSQDMEFHTPSLTPRNPKNQPDDFERHALETFQKDPSLKEFSERRVEDGKSVMRYAQAIRLTQDCLFCHGDPVGAKDPFGYAKEGMKAGDLRGAFSVRASTEGLVQTARSNSIALFLTSFLSLLAAAGVVFVLVRKLVTKPLSSAVDLANHIANNNLAVEDLPVGSDDEIGSATSALNTMKNNLRRTVQAIAEASLHVASASEELNATSQQITAIPKKPRRRPTWFRRRQSRSARTCRPWPPGPKKWGPASRRLPRTLPRRPRSQPLPLKSPKPPLPPFPSWAILRLRLDRSLKSSLRLRSRRTC
jgi:methyl-accepting chemotaxis protein